MAAIDTLTGVTELSHKLYEVTAIVDVGAGIDNVTDATFVMKDGGLMRWASGCTTTFTRCVFIETSTAFTLDFDNFNNNENQPTSYAPRFWQTYQGAACEPVFKACEWQCYLGARSDFDIQYRNDQEKASPSFLKDEYGNYCKVTIERDPAYSSFAQFNHFASDTITIDGLIIDHKIAPSGAFEFARIPSDTDQMKDLIILDNHPGDPARHTVLLGYNVPDNTSRTVKQLGARNIALFGGGFDYTLRLVDPVGYLGKADDSSSSQDGRLEGYRTFAGRFIDATTQTAFDTARVLYYTRTDPTDIHLDSAGADSFSVELLAYVEDYDSVVSDSSMNDYSETLCGYGYLPQMADVQANISATDPLEHDKGGVLMFPDLNVTNDEATAAGWADIQNAPAVYDAFHYLSVTRTDGAQYVGVSPVTRSGPDLDFGDYNVVIDPTLDLPYAVWSTPADQTHPAGATGTYTKGVSFSGSATMSVDLSVTIAELNASGPEGTGSTDWRLAEGRFGDSGTKFYLAVFRTATDGANRYLQWNCATPYDLSTATYHGAGLAGSTNGQENGFEFKPDGTRIYRFSRWGTWYQADLSTAWDITTVGSWTSITQPDQRYGSATFTPDGLRVFTVTDSRSYYNAEVREHTLTTAWDLSTMNQGYQATQVNFDDVNGWDASAGNTVYKNQIQFIAEGNKLLLHNGATNTLFFFDLPAAYDLTGISMNDAVSKDILGGVSLECNSPVFEAGASRIFFVEPRQVNADTELEVRSQPMVLAQSYAGAPNTAYIKATSIQALGGIETLRTTGSISLDNGAATDLQLVDASGVVTSLTVNGINAGTEMRVYRQSDDTEVGGVETSVGTQASINYTFTTPEALYIVLHNVQYTTSPRYIEFTTQAAPATLTVFQQLDRGYRND